jgi:hypothetical protein
MSGRELAYVKDVGILSPGFGKIPRSLGSGIDLRITESDLTLSPTGETLVLGGQGVKTVSFKEVKRISIKKDRSPFPKGAKDWNPDWYFLTVSIGGGHWWNRRGVGKIVLREWQFAQVVNALKSIPELKDKLNV